MIPTTLAPTRPARGTRRRRLGTVLAATVAALLLAAPIASADTTTSAPATSAADSASTTDLPQEEVAALTQSGIVYIAIEWQGYVQFRTSSGTKWSGLVKADFSCTGFVASSTGYIVTAGHCADPIEGRKGLIEQFLYNEVQNGDITAATANSLDADAVQNWKVEGDNNGSAIVRIVQVVQAGAASGVQVAQALTANVVDNRPLDQGDVTLLKVEAPSPMPSLTVATSVPDVGSNIAAMGFPGSVTGVVDPSLDPSYKAGRVSANQTFNGNPFTQVDAAFSGGMSGGPVVNMQGQVIGIVSYSPTGETQSFNFAAGQETVSGLLTRNGVKTGLTDADQAYRDGLTLFYNKQYHEAAAKFDVVLGTEPSHALAQKYKARSVANFAQEPTAPSSTAPVVSSQAGAAASGASTTPAIAPVAVTTSPATTTTVPAIANASSSTGTSGGIPIWVWIAIAVVVLGGAGAVLARTRRSTPVMAGGPAHPNQTRAPQPMYSDPNATQIVGQGGFAPQPTAQNYPVKQCTQCGSANAASARFCDNCGAPTGFGQAPYQR